MTNLIEAMLVLADGHYNHSISDIAVGMIQPADMYCENGTKYSGEFMDYLEQMGVDYYSAKPLIEEHVAKLPAEITMGDAYYALAMVLGDYGLAIHGDKKLALKMAYGWLTDPDK